MPQEKIGESMSRGIILIFALFFTAAAPQAQISRYVSEDPSGGMVLQVSADKDDVYPDEQIVLTYNLLTRYDTRYEGAELEEGSEGFWFKGAEVPSEVARQAVKRGSKKYIQATVRKKFFFPQMAGNFKIQPADLKIHCTVGKDFLIVMKFKGEDFLLTAPPIDIKVRNFPLAPQNFTGSLGKYSIHSDLEEAHPSSGIYALNITVEGEGNLWNVKLPKIDFGNDFAVLSENEQVSDKGSWKEEAVKGSKVFRYELLPRRVGTLTIPAIPFVYFNLLNQQYETKTTNPIAVNVDSRPAVDFPKQYNSGLAILIDRSGSMLAEDLGKDSRENVAKKIAKDLLISSSSDWFVVVPFAAEAQQKSEPKNGLKALVDYIENPVKLQDGTAIGDAVQIAIKALEQSVIPQGSKKIILIGDGANNSGHLDPKDAVKMAAKENIKIYSVALGKGGLVPFPINDPVNGKKYVQAVVAVDAKHLEKAAQSTGGKFFRIETPEQTEPVMRELNKSFNRSSG